MIGAILLLLPFFVCFVNITLARGFVCVLTVSDCVSESFLQIPGGSFVLLGDEGESFSVCVGVVGVSLSQSVVVVVCV